MQDRKNFGRRSQTRSSETFWRPPAPDYLDHPTGGEPVLAAAADDPPEIAPADEDELRDWKTARRISTRLPWRQIATMAVLSFAVASFALPEALNDALQWPLGALVAVSLYMGWRNRKKPAA